jgi:hypothetical protein
MKPNCYATWFGRAVWLGILVNLSFAVPALFTPRAFAAVLGLGGLAPEAAVWLRNAGMLLVVLSVFHAAVARDPLGAVPFARRVVVGRLVAAAFWLWLVWGLGLPGVLWGFFAADLALGLVCAALLFGALAVEPPPEPKPWRRSLYDRAYGWTIRRLEAVGVLWYKLWPPLLGSVGTGGLRRELRGNNLYPAPHDVPDTAENRDPAAPVDYPPHPLPPWDPAYRDNRSPDGSYNDLSDPAMGMVNMPFGRNFPPAETYPVVPPEGDPAKGFPSPREVSVHLLARDETKTDQGFQPATTLNLLAAAWIQFQNHGWFNHRIPKMGIDPQTGLPVPLDPVTKLPLPVDPNAVLPDFVRIPLASGDDWRALTGQAEMRVRRTVPDPTRRPGDTRPPQYRTTDTHWWDASQIYGSDVETLRKLRAGADGRLTTVAVTANGRAEVLLPLDPDAVGPDGRQGIDLTGFNDNHWVGTSLLHTLFVREHNFLCGELKSRYGPHLASLSHEQADEWLFGKARLIVAGLMAKIHTIEWTPGILGNPRLRIDMDSNWWGVLGKWFKIHVGRVSANEGVSGIIGSPAEHHAAPFALTEDFVAVYRLHPLIPDRVKVYSLASGAAAGAMDFVDTQGAATRDALLAHGTDDWMYSFGKQHPGAITLRNYPRSLRQFRRLTGEVLDLATRDIVRDRERGVPRYNRFRELLRMTPMRSYQELVGHRPDAADLVATLERLYGPDGIDRVDLMVGLFAEKVPPGFGFSDTAFRVFILMASRRLKSDRFFTDDFRPEVYTPFGIDWLNNETMQSLIERHYPALRGKIPSDKNTFAPW